MTKVPPPALMAVGRFFLVPIYLFEIIPAMKDRNITNQFHHEARDPLRLPATGPGGLCAHPTRHTVTGIRVPNPDLERDSDI
jgi:hypothetical protein